MKEKITQKAADMFLGIGVKSVTMDDIANEMGISKKTIYTHFNNKTELVRHVTLSIFDHICHGIDGICSLDQNPIEELYEIKKFVSLQLKNENSSPQYQLQKYYPQIYEEFKLKHFEKMYERKKKNLNRGVQMGLFRENLDIDFVSRIYFIGLNGIKDDGLFPQERYSKIHLVEEFLEYHLRGIVTPKGLQILNQFINTKTND